MSLLQTMINAEWLIEPEYLRKMYEIAARDNGSAPMDKAVETYAGRRMEGAYKVEMRGGVAVIPIKGAIFRYANLFTEICGATSIELLARDIQAAVDNPEVTGILFDIDSPGGQASGVNELAEIIYNARNVKPIKAYAGSLAASAAYFLAAAAEEIVIDDMATVGSIGVVSTISKKKNGETLEIVSSRAPNKRPDYSTDEGLRQAQERMDRLEDVFIEKVGKYRGLEFNAVVEAGNRGGVRIGRDAVKYKLCDRLGSFEGVIEEMSKTGNGVNAKLQVTEHRTCSDLSPSVTTDGRCEIIEQAQDESRVSAGVQDGTPPRFTEETPDRADGQFTSQELKESGSGRTRSIASAQDRADGQFIDQTERARVLEIMALGFPGAEEIVKEAISAGKSKGDAAVMLLDFLKSQKKKESLHIVPTGAEGEESVELKDTVLLIDEINKRNKGK